MKYLLTFLLFLSLNVQATPIQDNLLSSENYGNGFNQFHEISNYFDNDYNIIFLDHPTNVVSQDGDIFSVNLLLPSDTFIIGINNGICENIGNCGVSFFSLDYRQFIFDNSIDNMVATFSLSQLESESGYFCFDNFSIDNVDYIAYGNISNVPEPSMIWLFGLGFMSMSFVGYKASKKSGKALRK